MVASLPTQAESARHDEYHHHLIGIFIGTTSFDEEDGTESEFTYGAEYEFRFTQEFSLGVAYETAPDAHEDDGVDVGVFEVFYRPYSHWRVGIGYGQEKVKGDHPHEESLTRLGISYDFHVGDGFGIAPVVNIDFVDGERSYVTGLVFAKLF